MEIGMGKAVGLDGVVGWILKECARQIARPIHNVIETSVMKMYHRLGREQRILCSLKRTKIKKIHLINT